MYSTPNRKLVVEWYNRPHYANIGSATFEMVLFEDGDILYQYQDVNFGNVPYTTMGPALTSGPTAAGTLPIVCSTPLTRRSCKITLRSASITPPAPPNAAWVGSGGGPIPWLAEAPVTGSAQCREHRLAST